MLQQALRAKEEELQRSATHHLELTNTVSSLCWDVHRLKTKCNWAEESCSCAVEKAVDRVRKHWDSAETKRVKQPDGRIKDWVHDLVVELVALDGVPMTKVPQVIDGVWCGFTQKSGNEHNNQHGGNGDKQTISDCSVRQIMVEAYVKAFLYAASLFRAALCQYWNVCLTVRS